MPLQYVERILQGYHGRNCILTCLLLQGGEATLPLCFFEFVKTIGLSHHPAIGSSETDGSMTRLALKEHESSGAQLGQGFLNFDHAMPDHPIGVAWVISPVKCGRKLIFRLKHLMFGLTHFVADRINDLFLISYSQVEKLLLRHY